MRVLVSVDMEGVAGIATRRQVDPGASDYTMGRRLMTAEANAAAEGAFAGGATSVLINDAHGPMDNLLAEELDPRVEYLVGAPKPLAMVEGVDDADLLLMVGYHAGPSEERGVLAHTYSSAGFADVRVNGRTVTEAELSAWMAAEFGVPVGMVTGDDSICNLVGKAFAGVVTVPVKASLGYTAARTMTPMAARAAIRAGAESAVRAAAGLEVVSPPAELLLEVDLRMNGAAELACFVPGTTRTAFSTVSRSVASALELNQVLSAWLYLALAHRALN